MFDFVGGRAPLPNPHDARLGGGEQRETANATNGIDWFVKSEPLILITALIVRHVASVHPSDMCHIAVCQSIGHEASLAKHFSKRYSDAVHVKRKPASTAQYVQTVLSGKSALQLTDPI